MQLISDLLTPWFYKIVEEGITRYEDLWFEFGKFLEEEDKKE